MKRMTRSSTDLPVKLRKAIKAWSQRCPDKSFAGFTLVSFKEAVAPSLELLDDIAKSRARTRELISRRDDANVRSRKALHRLISGVKADEHEGEDSDLYVDMGYQARSTRIALQRVGRMNRREAVNDPQ
jgi:hypothetical protein